jgi:hypothetical protein
LPSDGQNLVQVEADCPPELEAGQLASLPLVEHGGGLQAKVSRQLLAVSRPSAIASRQPFGLHPPAPGLPGVEAITGGPVAGLEVAAVTITVRVVGKVPDLAPAKMATLGRAIEVEQLGSYQRCSSLAWASRCQATFLNTCGPL